MKSTSVAVLALIGQASAVKIAKEVYFASADDFDEPTQFYQNMAQAKTIANLDDFDSPEGQVEEKVTNTNNLV